jgi:uncharacterized membrane protein YphA (DoxX/SURF4 family)
MHLAPIKNKNAIVEIISLLLIFLFVYAAASKMLDYEKFRVQLGQSPMLTSFAGWVAWMVPSTEMIIALLLGFPRYRLAGLYCSFSLMVMFTTYIIAITRFSEYVPCSCGGVLQNLNWNQHLVFNIGFAMLALTGILFHSTRPEAKPIEEHTRKVFT